MKFEIGSTVVFEKDGKTYYGFVTQVGKTKMIVDISSTRRVVVLIDLCELF